MAKQITLDEELIRQEILEIIEKYGKLPEEFRFDPDVFDLNKALGVNKTAKLLYDGKKDKRLILDKTIAAPFQEIRRFGESKEKSVIEGEKYWYNKLIYGDNLQALKYLLDNGYKEKIKLIYIDPPFATKSDFQKGEVKAYKDKLDGAAFIEFLRERLVLMRELLDKNGLLFLHLDNRKGHYIKVILDELFFEHNFINQIVWKKTNSVKAQSKKELGNQYDLIFVYAKDKLKINEFKMHQKQDDDFKNSFNLDDDDRRGTYKSVALVARGKQVSEKRKKFEFRGVEDFWLYELEQLEKWWKEGKILKTKYGYRKKDYLYERRTGFSVSDLWTDKQVPPMQSEGEDGVIYPTIKPKSLLMRIIDNCSIKEDIVLDAFVGSGTTCVVAEKLNRRWIGIDAGKLAIYTSQKRILDIKKHKPFVVMNSGVYEIKDIDKQVKINKELYKEFACDLFQVDKSKKETINGIEFDGKYGNNFVFVFDSEGKIFRQDLEELEERLNGRLKRVYVIFSQNQDKIYTNYIKINDTQFYLHKIPHSLIVQFAIENTDRSDILNHLRQNYILKVNRGNLRNKDDEKAPEIDQEALKKINKISQPKKKSEIETKFSNIAGFDFVNTFEIEIEENIKRSKEYLEIEIKKVKIGEKTGIENLTMILIDKNYDGKVFKLTNIFFAEDDIEEDGEGNEKEIKGFIKTKKIIIDKAGIGNEIAVIYFDDFGNELMKQFEVK